MLKTRAYLCQTVTEATPMSRLASTVFSQAREALDGLFRGIKRPKVVIGTVARSPEVPALAVGRRGLIAGFDRGGRSLIRQFLARNRPADLAAAMRKRYSVRGEFQGYGQRLATFGFIGVGFAAGSQWGDSEVDRDFHVEPFFETVKTMFGGETARVDRSVVMLNEFQERLNECWQNESASRSESMSSFNVVDDSSISSDVSSSAFVDEISMLNDAVIELTNQKSDDQPAVIIVQSPSSFENSLTQLDAQLLDVLMKADAQRDEIHDLQMLVSQLNVALFELSDTTTSGVELPDDFVVLEYAEDDFRNDDDDERALMRALSLVMCQARQLDILQRMVCAQSEQLHSLNSQALAGLAFTSSDHCKRDACCGPGCAV